MNDRSWHDYPTDEIEQVGRDLGPIDDNLWADAQPKARGPRWDLIGIGALLFVVFGLVAFIVFRDDSESEAVAATVTSNTTGTSTTTTATSASSGLFSITEVTPPVSCLGPSAAAEPLETFLNAAVSQVGASYQLGAEVAATDPAPVAFDTSELVEWSLAQAGITINDGSWRQYLQLAECGATITPDEALDIPGALVFFFASEPTPDKRPDGAFVAISIGNGEQIIDVVEGQGVIVHAASERMLTHAATIPDLGTGTVD